MTDGNIVNDLRVLENELDNHYRSLPTARLDPAVAAYSLLAAFDSLSFLELSTLDRTDLAPNQA